MIYYETDSKLKKNSALWHGHVVPKDCSVVFMISICDFCPNLMRVQIGKVPHTHKELAYWKNNFIRV